VARKMKFPLITRFYMKIPFFIPPIKNFGTILTPAATDNQIYAIPANQFSPSASTTLCLHQFPLQVVGQRAGPVCGACLSPLVTRNSDFIDN